MSRTSLLGIALIILGIIGLTYHGTSYRTLPKKTIYEPVHVDKSKPRIHPAVDSVALPVAGALLLLGGIAILIINHENKCDYEQSRLAVL
jgi:uncharacterized membrane protein HdeD (DUF308 family)